MTFEEAWRSRVTIDLGGRTVGVIGRAALVRNKRATGRAIDLADAERLDPR